MIVTHRTDDNSKLPTLAATTPTKKPAVAGKATKRIKMKLQGPAAPPKAPPQEEGVSTEQGAAPEVGGATDAGPDAEEWIDAIPVCLPTFLWQQVGSCPVLVLQGVSCMQYHLYYGFLRHLLQCARERLVPV